MATLIETGRRLLRRARALTSRARLDRELDEELRSHLEMEVEYNVRQGLPPDEARARAVREFGGVARVREEAREARGLGPLEELGRDARIAARSLRRSPAYTAVAVLTLALGIGITAAVFSVVDGVLLRPLPYPAPERLVELKERNADGSGTDFAGANFYDVRATSRTLARVAAYGGELTTVLGADEALRTGVAYITRDFFEVLGAPPARGRTVAPGEGTAGGPQVAVVSQRFWERALGGTPDYSQRTLRVSGGAFPVVGVMPPEFNYPAGTDVWVTSVDENPSRTAHNWSVIGRLAPGATLGQARTELDGIVRRLKAQYGEEMDAEGVIVTGLHEHLSKAARPALLVLLGAVGLVLLVACVNLASANLARGETRQRELAVRSALGAGRGRLIRQLLVENLLVSLAGGALGVALAVALTKLVVTRWPSALPGFADVRVDGRVVAFAALASFLTGLLIGVAPAWQVTGDLRGAIGGGSATSSRGRLRTRGVLIGAEVALALALLAGAGLLVKSLRTLLDVRPGFRTERVLTADVALPAALYDDTLKIASFFDRLLPELRAIPGVERAGLINRVPLGEGGMNTGFMVDGGDDWRGHDADYRIVDSSYFGTLGIPVVQGRGFTAADRAGAPHAVVINRAMAKRYWPGQSALGHRIRPPGMDRHQKEWLTIVGVVADVRGDGLDEAPEPQMFVHYAQRPERLTNGATVLVRGTTPPDLLAAAVRARARAVDANVPVELSSLEALVANSVAERRFATTVLSAFALLALFLAALGVYGVLAYSVAQRQREIGVRMALGANRGTVQAMVLRDAMRAVLPGVVVGLVGSLALTRLLRGMLYEVSATDPATLAAVSALLILVALFASWLPARRATRVDPLIAIRAE